MKCHKLVVQALQIVAGKIVAIIEELLCLQLTYQ